MHLHRRIALVMALIVLVAACGGQSEDTRSSRQSVPAFTECTDTPDALTTFHQPAPEAPPAMAAFVGQWQGVALDGEGTVRLDVLAVKHRGPEASIACVTVRGSVAGVDYVLVHLPARFLQDDTLELRRERWLELTFTFVIRPDLQAIDAVFDNRDRGVVTKLTFTR